MLSSVTDVCEAADVLFSFLLKAVVTAVVIRPGAAVVFTGFLLLSRVFELSAFAVSAFVLLNSAFSVLRLARVEETAVNVTACVPFSVVVSFPAAAAV